MNQHLINITMIEADAYEAGAEMVTWGYSDEEVDAHWEDEFLPIARAADCAALHAELLEGAKSRCLADDLHQKLGALGDPCICAEGSCQAEHYGGNYFLCPDCEHNDEPSTAWDDIVFTITEDQI